MIRNSPQFPTSGASDAELLKVVGPKIGHGPIFAERLDDKFARGCVVLKGALAQFSCFGFGVFGGEKVGAQEVNGQSFAFVASRPPPRAQVVFLFSVAFEGFLKCTPSEVVDLPPYLFRPAASGMPEQSGIAFGTLRLHSCGL